MTVGAAVPVAISNAIFARIAEAIAIANGNRG